MDGARARNDRALLEKALQVLDWQWNWGWDGAKSPDGRVGEIPRKIGDRP